MNEKKSLININENPLNLFNKWFIEAKEAEINDPNAMNLSTVNNDLQPFSRIVLLKSFDLNSFVFYTSADSKKGKNIKENPKVALNFYWKSLRKQVRIEGNANIVSIEQSDRYFDSRPLESRIGAWASKQSSILSDRKELETRVEKFKKKFKDVKITRPPNWLGYSVKPNLFEFWQEMNFRLHDRVEFIYHNNIWIGKNLYP